MEATNFQPLWLLMLFAALFRFVQLYKNKQKINDARLWTTIPFAEEISSLISYIRVYVIPFVHFLIFRESEWYGPPIGEFIKDPRDLAIVLGGQKALGKDMSLYKVLVPFVGHGLVTSDVALWKKDRKRISPTFNQKNVSGYFNIFYTNSLLMIQELAKEDGKGLFDIYRYISKINLKTICETSLGITKESEGYEKFPQLVDIINESLDVVTERLVKVWNFLDITFLLSPLKRRSDKARIVYLNLMNDIIATAQQDYNRKKDDPKEKEIVRSKYLLEDLLAMNTHENVYTEKEIQAHINTTVFAGYETSASTVAFAMVLLAIHPEIQQKVYEEIISVVGEDKPLEYDDLKDLTYQERVLKETMRLFPIAPFLARVAQVDLQLTNKLVKAGTTIMYGILSVHKDPAIWPEPEKFDPERFLPEESAKRHPYSWIPFSAGPRNCLGIRYAWIVMRVMLTTILREYSVTTKYKSHTEIPMMQCFISKPLEGQLVQIKKRR